MRKQDAIIVVLPLACKGNEKKTKEIGDLLKVKSKDATPHAQKRKGPYDEKVLTIRGVNHVQIIDKAKIEIYVLFSPGIDTANIAVNQVIKNILTRGDGSLLRSLNSLN